MKRAYFKINRWLIFLIIVSQILVKCNYGVVEWEINTEELQMIEFIGKDSVNYSEFIQIANYVNMSGVLSTRGPFTLFLPDNDAWKAYYLSKFTVLRSG